MCGIGGFSLAPRSKINARKLSKALMCQLEQRGNQASGYAWSIGRRMGMYKKDVAGSKLRLNKMPKDAQNVILHTRLATHGSVLVSENNHPVLSPNQDIMLVHNGVIWNHKMVKKEIGGYLPEVDTAVIPALLEREGKEGLAKIDGDAAIAWLDDRNAGKLHVARIEQSPLIICQVEDGSFIFASTETILDDALKTLGIKPEWKYIMPERKSVTVIGGTIVEWETLPELLPEYEEFIPAYQTNTYRSMALGKQTYEYDTHFTSDEEYSRYTEDYVLGWNLVNGVWEWYDGEKVTHIDYSDDYSEEEETEYVDYDMFERDDWIKTFAEFKEKYYDEEYGWYYRTNTDIFVGNEDKVWEEYEVWRYEQHAKNKEWDIMEAYENWNEKYEQ